MFDRLERADNASELLAVSRICHGFFYHMLAGAKRIRSEHHAPRIDEPLDHHPAAARQLLRLCAVQNDFTK